MVLDALGLAHEVTVPVIQLISSIAEQVGKPKFTEFQIALPAAETQ